MNPRIHEHERTPVTEMQCVNIWILQQDLKNYAWLIVNSESTLKVRKRNRDLLLNELSMLFFSLQNIILRFEVIETKDF